MKVLLSITNQGWIHKFTSMAIHRLCADERHEVTPIWPTHRPYENNMCQIVNHFMKGDYDVWMNMDSDNPPMGNPLDLIDLDKDIIGCPTPVHVAVEGKHPIYMNAYKSHGDGYLPWPTHDGLQNPDAIGSGCFLAMRRVFENADMRIAPFRRTYHQDGTVNMGPDLYFSEKAKSNGFELWVHYDYLCRHFHEVDLLEMRDSYRRFGG